MSPKLHRIGALIGIVAVALLLASPTAHAEPHHGGWHGAGHARGRVAGHVFMGHGFARRVRAPHAIRGHGGFVRGGAALGHPFGHHRFIAGGRHRGFDGDHDGHRRFIGGFGDHRGVFADHRDGDWDHHWDSGDWRADHRGDRDHRDWDDHPIWAGGWWGGDYWPRVYYSGNYPWFLSALPAGVVTYWWDGVPYYYVNNVYYVWNSADDGYVAENPPPAAATGGQSWYSDPPTAAQRAAPAAQGPDDVYMYPEHGQSAKQQATDRYECYKWAKKQSGFDPTQPPSASSGSAADYHRALVACLKGRGYSVD